MQNGSSRGIRWQRRPDKRKRIEKRVNGIWPVEGDQEKRKVGGRLNRSICGEFRDGEPWNKTENSGKKGKWKEKGRRGM